VPVILKLLSETNKTEFYWLRGCDSFYKTERGRAIGNRSHATPVVLERYSLRRLRKSLLGLTSSEMLVIIKFYRLMKEQKETGIIYFSVTRELAYFHNVSRILEEFLKLPSEFRSEGLFVIGIWF